MTPLKTIQHKVLLKTSGIMGKFAIHQMFVLQCCKCSSTRRVELTTIPSLGQVLMDLDHDSTHVDVFMIVQTYVSNKNTPCQTKGTHQMFVLQCPKCSSTRRVGLTTIPGHTMPDKGTGVILQGYTKPSRKTPLFFFNAH